MCKLLLLLTVITFFSAQSIRMSDKAMKENGVKFVEIGEMKDATYGFYHSINVSVNVDGKLVVLDRGNHLIHVFKNNGSKIITFGKVGHGPGELSNAEDIYAFHSRIIVLTRYRIMIFNWC